MNRVSRSPLGARARRASSPRLMSVLRAPASLALAFALLASLAPLGAAVRAQAPAKDRIPVAEEGPAYVIYQRPDGDVSCRLAAPHEIGPAGNEGPQRPLVQLNHLPGKESATASASAGLTIILLGEPRLELPENAQAKQAFVAAAAKWEELISSQITVTIKVDYGPDFFGSSTPYGTNTLGQTSSGGFLPTYANVRERLISRATPGSEEAALLNNLPASNLPTDIGEVPTLFVPASVMRALGFSVNDSDVTIPRIGFNSKFSFDFDHTDGVSGTDFDSVAVHEIGHALGFTSLVGGRELKPSDPLRATVWDIFRFRPGAGTAGTFSSAPRVLSSGTTETDPHVYFSGAGELQLSTGKPDGTGGDDEQASHWKDDRFVPFIGIMDPTLPRGRHEEISPNDLRALDFFGYSIGAIPEPPNNHFANAQALPGASGRVTGTNRGATKEVGEPSHSDDGNPGGKSVWYTWTAPATGPVNFNTGPGEGGGAASNFDTLLAAYTGSSVNGLTSLAKNDDVDSGNVRTSSITFNATAGTTYRIAVDGWNADDGTIFLNWSQSGGTPTTVQFSTSAYSVSEGLGSITVSVTRAGGTNLAFLVGYSVLPGTADTGDYTTATSGALNFAAGETAKVITVGLFNDSGDEPNETLNLSLFNPTNGVTLGTPSTAVLTIIDDDDAQSGNSVIALSAPTYTASEAARAAAVTVTRSGNLNAVHTVVVRTVDNAAAVACNDTLSTPGIAYARCDYATTIETVTFNAGESSKAVTIPLIDDSHGEPTENVFIELSPPQGGGVSLGAQGSATLFITSDEGPGQDGAANPIAGVPFFVRQHYLDFLSREPEAGEPWSNVLNTCPNQDNSPGCDRLTVTAAFFNSVEFNLKGRFAFRFYKVAFGRLPEYSEIAVDMRLLTGTTGPEVIEKRGQFPSGFVIRDNFRAALGGLSNQQFVDTLMNRYNLQSVATFNPATPEGGAKINFTRAALVTALNAGTYTRAQVLRAIADSDEVGAAEFNPSFVAMQYYGYLRRTPEPGGFNNWLAYLNANPTDSRTMVNGFLNSTEYRLRFGRN
ncbi:MAG TPA: NF038122 family metalloprotease [Pyrinomonadaceae bacterium]